MQYWSHLSHSGYSTAGRAVGDKCGLVVPHNKWPQRSFNPIFLACRGLIHAWVAISGRSSAELGSRGCCGCCCTVLVGGDEGFTSVDVSPALLRICIFMNEAQEGMGRVRCRIDRGERRGEGMGWDGRGGGGGMYTAGRRAWIETKSQTIRQ